MEVDFLLPELGENVAGGDVLRVLVKPGDTIARDQPVLELETDKATIEVPSSVAGRVTAVQWKKARRSRSATWSSTWKVQAARHARSPARPRP